MTRNNFKIALRVIWRDKFNSAINLVGLTIGIACFLLLGLFVKQELSFDEFHSKKDRIYRALLKEDYGEGRIFFNSETPLRFEQMFEENFPELERVVQYIESRRLVGRGENRTSEKVSVVSPDLFEVFDFEVIEGNATQPLPTRESIILSRSFAERFYGDREPIGQTFSFQVGSEIRDFEVSAVFVDIPKESSIRFDIAVSTENGRDFYGDNNYQAWFSIIPETYVLVAENASVETVDAKMQDVVLAQMGDASYGGEPIQRDQYNIEFQPLLDIHLNPSVPLGYAPVSNPQYVLILAIIAVLVLAIACINYATIATGQSLRRTREVGMRKVMGAFRGELIYQYLSESIILALIATMVGGVLTFLLIPTFNFLTGTEIFAEFVWWHLVVYLCIGLAIGTLAGAYPALIMSRFKLISILQGGGQSTGSLSTKKGLMIIQFLVTVFLISTTLIMQRQIKYLQDKDLGFNYEAVISTQLSPGPNAQNTLERVTSGFDRGELLKARLSTYPAISNIAMGSHMFGTTGWARLAFQDRDGVFRRFRMLIVDASYLSAFGIEMKEGRGFEVDNGLDRRQSVILNQTAANYFGLDNPVGSKLPGDNFGEHQIIGVTKDFHFASLHSEIEPLVIVQNSIPIFMGASDVDFGNTLVPKLAFTYNGSNLQEATDILKEEWEELFPDVSWNYQFVDERISEQYASEARMNRLISVATVLSIVIASLGLLGLTMLVVNSKVKEIGIRKVMGASDRSLFRLLARGFLFQLFVSIVLSVPLTIWLASNWLENFAYRITLDPMLFVSSAAISILVALLVISYHTIRAARVNPVVSLRTE